MSPPVYMDHHIHAAITNGLRQRGIDVLTAIQDGHNTASDRTLLSRATELNRLLFTHDSDLLAEGRRRQLKGEFFSGLAYAHELAITIAQAIESLEIICKVCELNEVANIVLYLPI